MTRVVLVRQWRHASAGGGCCSADASCLGEASPMQDDAGHDDPVASAYRVLREHLPEVDVQVVAAGNTGYLVPATYRSARARLGRAAALRAAVRSTTAGAVLVDGEMVGRVETLGGHGVLREVIAATSR